MEETVNKGESEFWTRQFSKLTMAGGIDENNLVAAGIFL